MEHSERTPEPDVRPGGEPERVLQDAVKSEIERLLARSKSLGLVRDFDVLEGFGLDLAVFATLARGSRVRFVELKAFVGQRPGGVGFGNGEGEGAQVDILLHPTSEMALFDGFVCWILGDGTRPSGTARYVLFSCTEAKFAVMNEVARGKQNNFRVRQLLEEPLTWEQLCERIEHFILE